MRSIDWKVSRLETAVLDLESKKFWDMKAHNAVYRANEKLEQAKQAYSQSLDNHLAEPEDIDSREKMLDCLKQLSKSEKALFRSEVRAGDTLINMEAAEQELNNARRSLERAIEKAQPQPQPNQNGDAEPADTADTESVSTLLTESLP